MPAVEKTTLVKEIGNYLAKEYLDRLTYVIRYGGDASKLADLHKRLLQYRRALGLTVERVEKASLGKAA